jgi:choline dehydrogenase-like flavoprotein
VHDVVVVGAGAAGGWAAKELTERGLSVLLLDAGPEVDPRAASDGPQRRIMARLSALAGTQRIQLRCPAFDGRTHGLFVDDRDNPYTTPPGRPFNWFRGRQVGGRLHVWARIVPRLSAAELEPWPLSYDDLAPFYDRVESFLGVAEMPPTAEEERFKTDVERAFPARRVLSARAASYEPASRPRTIDAAARTGKLTLRPNSVVRTIATDSSGRATGVQYVDRVTREETHAPGRVVVLCASTVETLRIMLGSGIGSSSGRLGLGVMDHVLTGLGGPLPTGAGFQPADPADLGALTGFQMEMSPRWGLQGGIGRGTPTWYFIGHGEMSARPENRVTLDPRVTDAWGIPAARIDCAHGPDESALAREQLAAMREVASAAGLTIRTPPSGTKLETVAFRFWRSRLIDDHGAFIPGSAAHEVGGAPMGSRPDESVLDPFNRCWDTENVFVTDGAAFPSGCWQNVTLTIMALTVRACGHIADEHAAGRL